MVWSALDAEAARHEGWGINPWTGELQSLEMEKFSDDSGVWLHVRFWASWGNGLHERALAWLEEHSPGEYEMVSSWGP